MMLRPLLLAALSVHFVKVIHRMFQEFANQSVEMEENKHLRFVMLGRYLAVTQLAQDLCLALLVQEGIRLQLQHAPVKQDTMHQQARQHALFIVGTLWCTLLRPVMMGELEDATQLVQESM
jgi:hypothetical protein